MSVKIRRDVSVGKNIRELRQKAHMTQEQVVELLHERGIESSRSIYAQIECGRYNIRVSELVAFSEIFGVDYNAFFKDAEEGLGIKKQGF